MTTATQDHVRALQDALEKIDDRIEVLLDTPDAGISYDAGKDLREIQGWIGEALYATGGVS